MKTNTKRTHRGGVSYKILTLGVLSAIGAGLAGSSSAGALNADSLNRFCGEASSVALGSLTLDCPIEQSFLDSIISKNPTPIPEDGHEVNYNILDDTAGWGYDGKGVVFAGSDNLVPDKDGNPNQQMRTAKRGDKVGVSIKGTPGHFLPGTDAPLFWYELRAELTKGLVPDERSIQIKVDGTVLDSSLYTLSVEDLGGSSAEGIGYVITAKLEWAEYTKPGIAPQTWEFVRHLYDEDAVAELSFSAMVGRDTPSTASITATNEQQANGARRRSSTKSPATILIDGNLVIQRTDEAGEPLEGASYSVAGLKAIKDALNDNVFHYDSNGDITSFTTDEAGKVVILGVPLGQYTVTETETPEGHTIKQETQQVEVNWLSSSLEQYDSVVFEGLGNENAKYITRLKDGNYVLSPAVLEAGQNQLPYDSTTGSYVGEVKLPYTSTVSIAKNGESLTWTRTNWDNFAISGDFSFSEQLGKYVASWIHMPLAGTPSANKPITKEGDTLKIDDDFFRGHSLVLDPTDGCYHYNGVEGDGALTELIACEENNGYTALMTADYSELLGSGYIVAIVERFDYDENTGLYSEYATPSARVIVDEITPEYVKITGYPLLSYSPKLDLYYTMFVMSYPGSMFGSAFRKTIQPTEVYGTNILFSEMADNVDPVDVPEDTPNPQTSDTLAKAVVIMLVSVLPIAMIQRRILSRR